MKSKLLFTFTLVTVLLATALRAEEANKWTFDASLYGLLAGMSGNAGIGPVNADVDVGFDKIWDHLIGGFGVGSELTWQAYPYFNWQFTKVAALQVGYRWLSIDYETGSGLSRFKYDMLTQGPQIGFTLHF